MFSPLTADRLRRCILVVAGALALAACGGEDEPETVMYEASFDGGGQMDVAYSTTDGDVVETVTSPWSLAVERSGDFEALLEVRNPGFTGEVQCALSGAAFPAVEATGQAVVVCLASVSRSGGSLSVVALSNGEDFIRDVRGDPVAPITSGPGRQRAEAEAITNTNGVVLLTGEAGLYRLDSATGVVEQLPGSDGFVRPLSAAVAADGRLFAIDSLNNSLEVLASGDDDPSDFVSFDDNPALGEVRAFGDRVLLYDGRDDVIIAYDETAAEQWRYAFPERPNLVSKAVYMEDVGDGTVVIGSGELGIVGLDLASGDLVFSRPFPDLVRNVVRIGPNLFVSTSTLADGAISTTVLSVEDLDNPDAVTTSTVGLRIVADDAGVLYADEVDRISRLDPITFEVNATIEMPGRELIAAGSDRLYVSKPLESDSTQVTILAVPLSAFD